MITKRAKLLIGPIAVFGIGMLIGTEIPSRTPPVEKMTEGQMIDKIGILEEEKDKQVDALNAEQTMQFLQGDESMFASINQQISELSGLIARKTVTDMPKYELIKKNFQELQAKAQEKAEQEQATPSSLLEKSLGF